MFKYKNQILLLLTYNRLFQLVYLFSDTSSSSWHFHWYLITRKERKKVKTQCFLIGWQFQNFSLIPSTTQLDMLIVNDTKADSRAPNNIVGSVDDWRVGHLGKVSLRLNLNQHMQPHLLDFDSLHLNTQRLCVGPHPKSYSSLRMYTSQVSKIHAC